MVVERDEVLRRRQGGQMALALDGVEALELMHGVRHGHYVAVPIKPDNRDRRLAGPCEATGLRVGC